MRVYFINDGKRIIFTNEISNYFQFFLSKHFTARIRRIANKDSLRSLFKSRFQFIYVKSKISTKKGDKNRFSAGKKNIRAVCIIIRRKNNDLISPINDCHNRRYQCFRSSASCNDFMFCIRFMSRECKAIVRQCLTKTFRTGIQTVLMRTSINNVFKAVQNRCRR